MRSISLTRPGIVGSGALPGQVLAGANISPFVSQTAALGQEQALTADNASPYVTNVALIGQLLEVALSEEAPFVSQEGFLDFAEGIAGTSIAPFVECELDINAAAIFTGRNTSPFVRSPIFFSQGEGVAGTNIAPFVEDTIAATVANNAFLPTDITNLDIWLAADDSGSITAASGEVSSWADKGLGGVELDQSEAANQPNTATVNDRDSLFFDGGGDHLDNVNVTWLPPFTVAVAFTPTAEDGIEANVIAGRSAGFSTMYRIQRDGTDLKALMGTGGGTTIFTVAGALSDGETAWAILRGRVAADGDSDLLIDDGTERSGVGQAALETVTRGAVGAQDNGANPWTGHIHEAIVYNNFVSDAERDNLATYLTSRWIGDLAEAAFSGVNVSPFCSNEAFIAAAGTITVSGRNDAPFVEDAIAVYLAHELVGRNDAPFVSDSVAVSLTHELSGSMSAPSVTNIATATAGSSFSPDDLASLELWYDASDASSITETSGDVSGWADLSGNAGSRDLEETTAEDQPTTSAINGNDSLLFDGINSTINNSSMAALGIEFSPMTVAIVVTPTTLAGINVDLLRMRDSGFAEKFSYQRDAGTLRIRHRNSSNVNYETTIASALAVDETMWAISTFENGTQETVISDGSTASSTEATLSTDTLDDFFVGSGSNSSGEFEGHIHEVILFSSALSSTEVDDLADYLDAKWTIS